MRKKKIKNLALLQTDAVINITKKNDDKWDHETGGISFFSKLLSLFVCG